MTFPTNPFTDDDPTRWCVIVDTDLGEIVQVHQNIALLGATPMTRRELTQSALRAAMGRPGDLEDDVRERRFEVIHPPDGLVLDPQAELMLRNGDIDQRPRTRRRR
ncbi:MAG: hypothetical protein AAGD35_13955 [Actinomycetota bacterium]